MPSNDMIPGCKNFLTLLCSPSPFSEYFLWLLDKLEMVCKENLESLEKVQIVRIMVLAMVDSNENYS